MFLKKITVQIWLCFALIFLTMGCVEDVEFEQAEEIGLSPHAQINLLNYNVSHGNFVELEEEDLKQELRDTVRLEFLQESAVQDNLTRVELLFKSENTFPHGFLHKIYFLSESGRKKLSLEYYVEPGSEENPVSASAIEIIGEERINKFKESIQMEVVIEVQPQEQAFKGELQFKSTGLFSFDF